jgi:hypothetical protein
VLGASGLDARLKGATVNLAPKASRLALTRVEPSAKSRDGFGLRYEF